jgi:osmotically-inducible protein OsmY
MKSVLLLIAAALVAGCNPYMAAVGVVSQTYGVATDDRSVSTQASDTEIEAQIKTALLASPVSGTDGINIFCTRGVVVLAGAVPRGSDAGRAAAAIARQTSGVRRVETFFVDADPSTLGDIELQEKIKAAFVEDPTVAESQVKIGAYGGHVVLVGLVSNAQQAEQFVDDAQGVSGVRSVRSYIQTQQ